MLMSSRSRLSEVSRNGRPFYLPGNHHIDNVHPLCRDVRIILLTGSFARLSFSGKDLQLRYP